MLLDSSFSELHVTWASRNQWNINDNFSKFRNSVSHSVLPTIFLQALSTPLAIVCPPRSVKIIKETILKNCRWVTHCKKVDESRYYLDFFVLLEVTTKRWHMTKNPARTSSFSSSFLVSSLDFVSSFLSDAVSFSFFCSATGAMLESMKSEACTDSWDLLPSSQLCSFPRGHKFSTDFQRRVFFYRKKSGVEGEYYFS